MGIKFSERFESHMDGIDAGTKGDAKKIEDVEEDSYDDGFDEKLSDALSESTDAGVDDNVFLLEPVDQALQLFAVGVVFQNDDHSGFLPKFM